jgi:aromatic-L-amino-acid decarboxylase
MNALHLPEAEFRSLAARVTDIAAILRRVIERGRVYLSNATLGGRFALRACFVNHRTTDQDVGQIVPEVLEAAREVLSG